VGLNDPAWLSLVLPCQLTIFKVIAVTSSDVFLNIWYNTTKEQVQKLPCIWTWWKCGRYSLVQCLLMLGVVHSSKSNLFRLAPLYYLRRSCKRVTCRLWLWEQNAIYKHSKAKPLTK